MTDQQKDNQQQGKEAQQLPGRKKGPGPPLGLLGAAGRRPFQHAFQRLMQQVEVDNRHQAARQDPQGELLPLPDEAGHYQHGQDQPVGYLQPSRGQDLHGNLFIFLPQEVDLPEAGDNPHDEPEDEKNTAVKVLGQPVTGDTADKNGDDQDQADGAGPVTPLKQFL